MLCAGFRLCLVQVQSVLCAVRSLRYVQSLACVMRSLLSFFCVASSVSGSPLKRLVAALLIPADIYIYIYIYIIYEGEPGPCGLPWVFVGRTLVGFLGPCGPRMGSCGPGPCELTLVGPPGPS